MFWDLRISYFFERKVIFLETGNQFLGTERVSKLMRQYAIPCIISLLVGALYNIVDQIFIANASYLRLRQHGTGQKRGGQGQAQRWQRGGAKHCQQSCPDGGISHLRKQHRIIIGRSQQYSIFLPRQVLLLCWEMHQAAQVLLQSDLVYPQTNSVRSLRSRHAEHEALSRG